MFPCDSGSSTTSFCGLRESLAKFIPHISVSTLKYNGGRESVRFLGDVMGDSCIDFFGVSTSISFGKSATFAAHDLGLLIRESMWP